MRVQRDRHVQAHALDTHYQLTVCPVGHALPTHRLSRWTRITNSPSVPLDTHYQLTVCPVGHALPTHCLSRWTRINNSTFHFFLIFIVYIFVSYKIGRAH